MLLFIVIVNPAFSIVPELEIGKMYVLNEFYPDNFFVPLDFFAGTFSVEDNAYRVQTLLWFNASSLTGTKIESAKLYLYTNYYDYDFTSAEQQAVEIYRVVSRWDNATWNTKPRIESEPIAKITVAETGSEAADIAKLVQEWTDSPEENFGILLKPENEENANLKAFTLDSFISVNYSLKEEPQNECEANNGICSSECFQNEEEKDYSCGFLSFKKCCIKKPEFCNNDSICDSKETKESCPVDCKDIFELKCSSLPLTDPEEKPAEFFEAPPEPPEPHNLSTERKGHIIEFKDEPLLSKKKELMGYLEQLRSKAQNYREGAKNSFIAGKIYSNIAAYYLDYQANRFNKKIPKELNQYSALLENNQKISLNEIKKEISGKNALRVYKNTFNGIFMDVSEEEANSLKKFDFVKNIYPNLILKPLLNESVSLIGAGSALEAAGFGNLTGKNVSIAIIDTGVDYTHPDLGNCSAESFLNGFCEKVIGGFDFVNNDSDPMDDNGHGTHIAATAVGNGILKGVAPDAKIYAYKVCDFIGCSTDAIIAAIERSVDPNQDGNFSEHVDVISMSLGGPGDSSSPTSTAVSNAVDNGITIVIAAGNDGPANVDFSCRFFDKSGNSFSICSPGTSTSAITVGASSKNNSIAEFSSRGPTRDGRIKPDVVASGKNICAAKSRINELEKEGWTDCLDKHHISLDGTSMATPHVSGAAAVLKQAHPEWKPADIKSALMLTATDLGSSVYLQGSGLINVSSALNPPFLVNNPNIFMGEIEDSASASIEFKNIKEEEILISLSLSNITNVFGNSCNNIKASLNNHTILIAPKSTQIVNFSIGINDMDGIFNGFIIAEHSGKKYKIPYSFTKFANQSLWFNADVSIPYANIKKSVIGEEDTLAITIQNIGERISKSSTLIFEDLIDEIVVQKYSNSLNPLKAGEEIVYYLNWTPQSSGEHTLRFSLDTENDKDKTNNAYEVNHTVLVKGIDLAALLLAPDFAVLNYSYKLLVAVHNLGSEPASDINIKVYETIKNTTKEIGNLSFDLIDSDEGIAEEINWTPSDFGTAFLEVNATAPNDNNTLNNYYGTEVNVIPEKPDLKVDLFAFPFYIINTMDLVSAGIKNLGFNAAENITLEFYENSTLLNSTQLDSLDGATWNNLYFIDYKYTPTIEGDKLLRLIAKVDSDADYLNNEKNITISVLPTFKSSIEVKNSFGNISGAFVGIGDSFLDFIGSADMELLQNKVNISVFEERSAANIEKVSTANFITVFEDSLLQENMALTVSNYSGVFKGNGTLLYSIYAKNANWSYSKISLINLPGSITYRNASGSYQLFKCKVWNFEKETCTTGWEESVEVDDNANISFSGSYDAIGFGGKDYDSDNLIDLIDNDDDNDGLNDSVDKINCRSEKITVPKRNFSISLFDNKNLASSAFQRFWELRETGKPLIEVNLEENGKINCKNPVIISDKRQNKNFLIVNGLEISNSTKTAYLDASGNSTNTSMICIKDREIAGIDEISDSCNGESELILKCDGKNRSSYACVLAGQKFKISGLAHSGVIELGSCRESWQCASWSGCSGSKQTRACIDINECGTNTGRPAEMQTCSDAAAQSGVSRSSQYSSAGSPFYVCNREWKCNDWSACANGIKVRGCEYIKAPQHASEQACPTESNKPSTTQKCEAPAKHQEKTGTCFDGLKNQNEINIDCGGVCKACETKTQPKTEQKDMQKQKTNAMAYIISGSITTLIIAIMMVSFLVIKNKKAKMPKKLSPLENYVRTNLALGYQKAMIRQKLLEAGWKEELVDNVLKKF